MPAGPRSGSEQVRTAEVIAALCLATDLGMRLPFEHGLHSTLFAMRLSERLAVDSETALQTYYGCLLFYVGCTADAEISAEIFEDEALVTHFTPVMFGSRRETMTGIMRALATPTSPAPVRLLQGASRLPRAGRGHQRHLVAMCEVAQMLCDQLGMPTSVRALFLSLTERWDGKGGPAGLKGQELPLALRIIHVARDAAFQRLLGGEEHAVRVIRARAGGAFDPAIAEALAEGASEILALDDRESVWERALEVEPHPQLTLRDQAIDRALAAMGDFADLVSPYLVGHSAGVAELASAAAKRCNFTEEAVVQIRRAGSIHDVGRVAVATRIWQKPGPLSPDEWEQVRLHPYHSERVLSHSAFLAGHAVDATAHHERLDGSGYHRGMPASAISPAARLLAAADAYQAMTQARPHRAAHTPSEAADLLSEEARTGRLDATSVAAVLDTAGHHVPAAPRPAGLTERESQVVALLARGLQTKQVGRALGISTKTADRHVQNAYAKIGVSTRAAAALFAMQHGLVIWGELPILRGADHS